MKRFGQDLYRARWVLLFTCAALLLGGWWYQRGRPERLGDLPLPSLNGDCVIRNGKILYTEKLDSPDRLLIRAVPVRGGKSRSLTVTPLPGESVENIRFEGERVYFVAGKRTHPFNPGGEMAAPVPLMPSAATVTQTVTTRPRRVYSPPYWKEACLYEMPLQGGAAREILPGLKTASAVVVGENVYWLRALPDELWTWSTTQRFSARGDRRPAGNRPPGAGLVGSGLKYPQNGSRMDDPLMSVTYHSRTVPHSELMATPLTGGPARRVMQGLRMGTRLISTEAGLILSAPRAGEESGWELYSLRKGDPIPRLLPGVDGGSPFVVAGGRLYWVRTYGDTVEGHYRINREELISVRPDGSDRRIVYRREENGKQTAHLQALETYQGKLYAVLAEHTHTEESAPGTNRYALCRIHPERSTPLERLTALPPGTLPGGMFAEGYYYFVVEEERENWLDWSPGGLAVHNARVLYQYRLPD